MILRLPHLRVLATGVLMLGLAAVSTRAAVPISTERLSVASDESEAFGTSYGAASMSADGRLVAFPTSAYNLTSNATVLPQIVIRDRQSGFTQLGVLGNPTTAGGPHVVPNGATILPSLSGDGRYLAFASGATNLVSGDTNNTEDVFVRDLRGNVVRVSVDSSGAQGTGGYSDRPHISRDGSTVIYVSSDTNLVAGDSNGTFDVFATFLRQTVAGGLQVNGTVRVSTDANGVQANGQCGRASVSADGTLVAFESVATNLVPGDTNGFRDIFVKDLISGNIERISVDDLGNEADGDSFCPTITPDGRYVTYSSNADNLVSGDTNGAWDVFIYDRQTQTTERVSVATDGTEGDGDSGNISVTNQFDPFYVRCPSITDDGRFVVFNSDATNLVDNDGNGVADIFVHDRTLGTTDRVSIGLNGVESDGASSYPIISPVPDADNNLVVAYVSAATNLVDSDTNGSDDIFATTLQTGDIQTNTPPTADAGPDQDVAEFDTVTLDGSNSSDPDLGDTLTYAWTQLAGPTVTLDDPAAVMPTFTAPEVESFASLEFQLSVSDGVNPASLATVFVDVSAANPGFVQGNVTDQFGQAVPNATIVVLRDDGVQSGPITTDQFGNFGGEGGTDPFPVRAGSGTITVSADGFEPLTSDISVTSDETQAFFPTLDARTGNVHGTVLLSKGAPAVGVTVQLLDGQGAVMAAPDGTPYTATTDSSGSYQIGNITSSTFDSLSSVQVTADSAGLIPWTLAAANLGLSAGDGNTLNLRYGTLVVKVDGSTSSVKKKLNGTEVDLLIGNKSVPVAKNFVSNNVRTLTFANIPATSLRIRASNPSKRLTGAIKNVTVHSGPSATTTTIVIKPYGTF